MTALCKPKDVEDSEAAVERPQFTAISLTSSFIDNFFYRYLKTEYELWNIKA